MDFHSHVHKIACQLREEMVPGKARKHERLEKACTSIEEGSKQCYAQFIYLFAACLKLQVESK